MPLASTGAAPAAVLLAWPRPVPAYVQGADHTRRSGVLRSERSISIALHTVDTLRSPGVPWRRPLSRFTLHPLPFSFSPAPGRHL